MDSPGVSSSPPISKKLDLKPSVSAYESKHLKSPSRKVRIVSPFLLPSSIENYVLYLNKLTMILDYISGLYTTWFIRFEYYGHVWMKCDIFIRNGKSWFGLGSGCHSNQELWFGTIYTTSGTTQDCSYHICRKKKPRRSLTVDYSLENEVLRVGKASFLSTNRGDRPNSLVPWVCLYNLCFCYVLFLPPNTYLYDWSYL